MKLAERVHASIVAQLDCPYDDDTGLPLDHGELCALIEILDALESAPVMTCHCGKRAYHDGWLCKEHGDQAHARTSLASCR